MFARNQKNRVLSLILFLLLGSGVALGQGSGFTYQGRLTDGGTAANGNYDLQFALWDSLSGGTQVGSTQSLNTVAVTSGVFTVSLDFGASSFPGANRFLEIRARQTGSTGFIILEPRQPITSTPYAVRSLSTASADNVPVSGVPAGSGNYIQNTSSAQTANFNISGNGTIGGTLTANSKIGVGTTNPLAPLDVRGNLFIGLTSDPGPVGMNSIFLANDAGDSHNSFRIDGANDNLYIIGRSNSGAATDTGIIFRTAAKGTGEVDRVRIDGLGNVGVGTDSPQASLDVRGDVKLGSTGQLFAPGGEESLRIIRGNIFGDGTIAAGSGFTVSSPSQGVFYIMFNTPFSGTPAVTATPERNGFDLIVAEVDSNCGCDRTRAVKIVLLDSNGGAPFPFLFTAIGPR